MEVDDEDRMHMIDAVWLEIEQTGGPIAVGAVLQFSGRAPAVTRVRQRIGEILDFTPRLHQIPQASRSGVLQPKWVDVEVDLTEHVTRQRVEDLDAAVSEMISAPMPTDRPMWEVRIVTGYAPREWALVWRLHHAVADGEGVTMLVGRTLDMEPGGGETMTTWMMAQAAAWREAQRAARGQDSGGSANPLDRLSSTVREAFEYARGAVVTAPETARSLLRVLPHRPTELTGAPSPGRDWRATYIALADVKRAGKAHGATVNDVLMAAVANGFRDVVDSHGDDAEGRQVRAVMPVSLRRPGDVRSNNQVSMIPVELPIGDGDPRQRLSEVVRQTRQGKRSMFPMVVAAMQDVLDRFVPAPVTETVVAHSGWTISWMTDTLVTNVRGPEVPLYFLGQEVRYLAPIIPIGSTLRTVVGINSYNGWVNVSVTGDAAHAEDNAHLIAGIADGVAQLLPD